MKKFCIALFSCYTFYILAVGIFLSPVAAENNADAGNALQAFSSYYRQVYSCTTFREFVNINKHFKSQEKLQEVLDAESQMSASPQGEALVSSMFFMMIKPELIHPNEITNIHVQVTLPQAEIIYGRAQHPEFKGKATLLKENNQWKIVQLTHSKSEAGGRSTSSINF